MSAVTKKLAEPLTSKDSAEVAKAFLSIYKRSPLTWPQLPQVDAGRESMGSVTKEMENHKTYVRRGRAEIHRDQAVVERFNRTLVERLFWSSVCRRNAPVFWPAVDCVGQMASRRC